MTAGGKSKTTGVVLAVFLSAWSWLYTYKANSKKFWIAIGLWVVAFIFYIVAVVSVVHSGITCDQSGLNCQFHSASGLGAMVIISIVIWIGVWLWAIIDNATKTQEFFSGVQ